MSTDALILYLIKMVAGAAGATMIALFTVPSALADRGRFIAGAQCGAVGAGSAVAFTGMALRYMGLSQTEVDIVLPIALIIGVAAVFIFGALANWMKSNQDKDITQVVAEVRKTIAGASDPKE